MVSLRRAHAAILSVAFLSTWTAVLLAGADEPQSREEQIRRQFETVTTQFRINPSGYYYYYYYYLRQYLQALPLASAYSPNDDPRTPGAPSREVDRGSDLVAVAGRPTEVLMIAGLRAFLYAAILALLTLIAPKRFRSQVFDGNTAAAIVAAAIAIGLAIVIASAR